MAKNAGIGVAPGEGADQHQKSAAAWPVAASFRARRPGTLPTKRGASHDHLAPTGGGVEACCWTPRWRRAPADMAGRGFQLCKAARSCLWGAPLKGGDGNPG